MEQLLYLDPFMIGWLAGPEYNVSRPWKSTKESIFCLTKNYVGERIRKHAFRYPKCLF